jgi:cytochrome c
VVWTPDKLNAWVQKPSALVPGVKMNLPPVSDPRERADLIAFLKVQSPSK